MMKTAAIILAVSAFASSALAETDNPNLLRQRADALEIAERHVAMEKVLRAAEMEKAMLTLCYGRDGDGPGFKICMEVLKKQFFLFE